MALDFDKLFLEISRNEIIEKLKFALPPKCYLVGGFIRDSLLGRKSSDIDIIVEGEIDLAVKSAELAFNTSAFNLGERFRTQRLIIDDFTVDFSPLYGSSIVSDLLRRDFSVNAIAIPLMKSRDALTREDLIDPARGLESLENGEICVISENNFREDPVRLLRAFRFMAELGFSIEDNTQLLICHHANLIPSSPAERIREEVLLTLNNSHSFPSVKLMSELGVLEALFPQISNMRDVTQNEYHHLPVYEHSLECIRQLEALAEGWDGIKPEMANKLTEHFSETVTPPGTRFALVKLALLFHDLGKPKAREVQVDGKVTFYGHQSVSAELARPILENLRMSGRERDLVLLLIEEHLRVGFYCNEAPISPKLIYRYERKLGDATVMGAIHALADARATRGPAGGEEFQRVHQEVVNEILWHHFFQTDVTAPVSILSGDEIMDLTGLPRGPKIGELKEALLEAQVEGKVKTREEAEAFIRNLMGNKAEI